MKWLTGFTLGILIALTGPPARVLANGDDVHLGDFHFPMTALWIGAGIVIAVFVLLAVSWAVSRRARQRSKKTDQQG